MFEAQLEECRELAGEAKAKLQELKDAAQPERVALSTTVYSLLKQADGNLQAMQLEARSAPAQKRAELTQAEAKLREELKGTAKELEQAKRELLLGQEEVGGNAQKLFLTKEDRSRMSAVTDSMKKGTDRLKEANRQAVESETVGIETLQELRRQREVMERVKGNTDQLGQNLKESDRSLKELEKPECSVM
mmetsp:Transcript_17532/g.40813  ORF Transcript_17532/g.40813 Transcript_17532/m.40813 type:complete len:191 (-) Transcript_17532:125-697(-)|eukprot:CAMPEP_0178424390 /NCGR_PEP_ID=MMETSP0689_2-20121128/28184_1 /TAXON_ID=160604 /ORGANISM="Amphidinium massartii, Strain CS-259" /LENGTH=190 /DNA_ID=CAMNT_0020046023 /DNA_START=30 /DNA_END=602 /DNA_ORIENTATION=+